MKRLSVTDGTKYITIPKGQRYVIEQSLNDILYITLEPDSQLIFNGFVKCHNLVCHPNSSVIFNEDSTFGSILLEHGVDASFKAKVRCTEVKTKGDLSLTIEDSFFCQSASFSEDTDYTFNENTQVIIHTDPQTTQSITNIIIGDSIDGHDNF